MSKKKFDQSGILQTEIRQRDNIKNSKSDDLYKNFNFLQKEKVRLEKLHKLVHEKVNLLQTHSQISLLSIQEEEQVENLKDQIIARSIALDSQINKKMIEIYQKKK
jgi:hypothetical protein